METLLGNHSAPPLNDYGLQLKWSIIYCLVFMLASPEQCRDLLSCSCKKSVSLHLAVVLTIHGHAQTCAQLIVVIKP